jgi:hypothetical protein
VGLQDEVRKLVNADSAKHKRLIEYVVRQLEGGRDLAVVLEDPYVTNRLDAVDRLALLEEPEVIHAASDEVLTRPPRPPAGPSGG